MSHTLVDTPEDVGGFGVIISVRLHVSVRRGSFVSVLLQRNPADGKRENCEFVKF